MLSLFEPYLSLAHAKDHLSLDVIKITPLLLLKLLMVGLTLANHLVLLARITLLLCIMDPMWGCCHRQ